MRFASSITAAENITQASEELLAIVDQRLTLGMVDLAIVFFTAPFVEAAQKLVDAISEAFPSAAVIGCSVEGTIGLDSELERVPSVAMMAATLPDVEVRPFYLRQKDLQSIKTEADWGRFVGAAPENHPTFIALADPFRFAIHDFVDRLNGAYPGTPLLGGVASAGVMPEQNRLIIGGDVHREGMVGVTMTGDFRVDTVVSQGCRPIGKPFVITKGDRNVIQDLGGKAPLEQLHEVLLGLSEEDEKLARQSLFLGRAINEYKDTFARGDFLIHNIIGVDRKAGAIALAGHARVGATVQFHVRDAASADEDLRALVKPFADTDVRGALLFDCNGRGTRMWPQPGHDVGVLRELLPDTPVAGCFCAGEFGPVGGKNFVHGFTAGIALFRPPPTE